MFTGIVEDIGEVKKITDGSKEKTFFVKVNNIDSSEIKLGESIAVNGICLTVVSVEGDSFSIEASHETLDKTNLSNIGVGSKVNLERALKVNDRFGGHIVTGHIDGIAKVVSIKNVGKSIEYVFEVGKELSKYFISKGSVAVDGISLTVNSVEKNKFAVNIIPYTQTETTISSLEIGDKVNIECDIVGKYIEKLLMSHENEDSRFSELLNKL